MSTQGLLSGHVFDAPTQAVRPIVGLPGTAYLGSAAVGGVQWAAIAPGGRQALVRQGGRLLFIRDLTQPEQQVPVDGSIEAADQILWASDSTAVLCSSDSRQLQRIHITVESIKAGEPLPFPSQDGVLAAVATDAAGEQVALAFGGESGALLLANGSEWLPAVPLAGAGALVFSADGTQLYAIEGANGRLVRLEQATGWQQPETMLDGPDTLRDVAGLLVTGSRLLIASRQTQSLLTVDLAERAVIAETKLDQKPALLRPLPQSRYLLVSQRQAAGDAVLIVDPAAPSAFFVPVGEQ